MSPGDDNVVQMTYELLKRMDAKLDRMSLSPNTPEGENVTNELLFKAMQRIQADIMLLRNSFRDQQSSINSMRDEINLLRSDIHRYEDRILNVEVRQDCADDRMELRDS